MRVAIEGIDGSGKETQTRLLVERTIRAGVSASSLSFPRYGSTTAAEAITAYLSGAFGELPFVDPMLAGLLFATDRFESRAEISRLEASHDILIFDRYVASNIAHQVSRVDSSRRRAVREWLERVEFEVFAVPRADVTVLLDLDPVAARSAAERRAQPMDLHERDQDYLRACREAYLQLADGQDSWHTIRCSRPDGTRLDISEVAAAVWDSVGERIAGSAAMLRTAP